MSDLPIDRETYNLLVEELDNLKKVQRPEVIEEITVARENGDLKENADYHAAREKQGHIEDRITVLEDRIARSVIVEVSAANSPHIIFGAKVTVQNHKIGKEQKYEIVSPDAVDPINGKISNTSPIGQALIGKKKGEFAEVSTPRGIMKLEVLDYN